MTRMFFYSADCDHFRNWLDLNWEAITWQRKFEEKFQSFWETFFLDGISLKDLMGRYNYARKELKIGPLYSWVTWLKEKNLCYFFIYKNISLYDLALEAEVAVSELANILRNFFIEKFPHLDDYFNEKFHVGNITSEHLYLSFATLEKDLGLTRDFKGSHEDEIMTSLEVTLYDHWEKFLARMKKEFFQKGFEVGKLREKITFGHQKRFFQETLALFFLGAVCIHSLKIVNQWYEDRLSKKIRLFEPDFLWTDKSLAFKNSPLNSKKIEMELKEMEKLKVSKVMEEESEREERFEEETDVIISSVETLPQDIQRADLEQSKYEEALKGGYRDEIIGSKKVYRIMMKSSDVAAVGQKINSFLKNYGVTQVNTVRPGTSVPGGVYFNLYVPHENLLEFLSKVGQVEESSVYVSKTSKGSPPGKTKVFIWIKEI